MISIVIPCLEDELYLPLTLKSIFGAHLPQQEIEVFVVYGNCVTSPKSLEKFPIIELHGKFEKQADALNFGIAKTKGDLICTTKPGCIVYPDWLIEIEKFFRNFPKTDGVCGPVFPATNFGTKIQRLASQIFSEESNFPSTLVFLESDKFQPFFHSTNNAFRRKVFGSVEYDNAYTYDFDWDISWKLLRMHYHLAFNPKIRITYIFPSTLQRVFRRYSSWGRDYSLLLKAYNIARLNYLVSPYYNMIVSFYNPTPAISEKKLLKLVQHVFYILGRISSLSN